MRDSSVRNYEFIDALRGLAILAVMLVHASQAVPPSNARLAWLMGEGAKGVQLFYVASAFTLCLSWQARNMDESSPVRNFYIRRFFRIAPLFYIGIVVYSMLNGLGDSYWAPNGISWWFLPLTALFLHGFHPETINSVVPGGWSIAVEVSFYLIFPFLFVYLRTIRVCGFAILASLIAAGASAFLIPRFFSYPESQQYIVKNFQYLNFFAQLPVFLIAILAYRIFRSNHSEKGTYATYIGLCIAWLVIFLLPLWSLPTNTIVQALSKLPRHLVATCFFCTFALLLAKWPTRLFVNGVVSGIGRLSFGLYISHFGVIAVLERSGISGKFDRTTLACFAHFVLVVMGAVVVSLVLHKYIEKPCIGLGRRLVQTLEQRQAINQSAAREALTTK